MKDIAIIGLLIVIALIMSCQPSAQTKSEMENQTEQIRMLEQKVDAFNTKIDQLMKDFKKHMDDFHQKTSKQKKLPAMGYLPITNSFFV
jgi:uncharacterized protein YoxC